MDDEHTKAGPSGWSEGRVLGPEAPEQGTGADRSFRTLETPGALAPSVVPAPWSFDPGLPAGVKVEAASLSKDAFLLSLLAADGGLSHLRCRVTAAGRLAGEAGGPASPSLFSPGREAERQGQAWILEAPDHRVALVVEPRGAGVRFGLAWGNEAADVLATAAEALLQAALPALPRVQEADTAAKGPEPSQKAPSSGAEWMNRHGAKALVGALALIVVMVIWGAADAPGTGKADHRELTRLIRQLNYIGRFDEALAICDQAEKRLPAGTAPMLKAQTHYRRGDYDQAAELYRQAMEEGSIPEVALLNLASSLYRAGKPAEAAAAYQDFIDAYGEKRPLMAKKAASALEVLAEVEGTLSPKNVGH